MLTTTAEQLARYANDVAVLWDEAQDNPALLHFLSPFGRPDFGGLTRRFRSAANVHELIGEAYPVFATWLATMVLRDGPSPAVKLDALVEPQWDNTVMTPSLELATGVDLGAGRIRTLVIAGSLKAPMVRVRNARLVVAGDILFVRDNPTLGTMDMPALTAATSILEIKSNNMLAGVSFPALTTADRLKVSGTALTELRLPALLTLGELTVGGANPSLGSINLPALTQVTGSIYVNDNTALTLVNLPVLTASGGHFNVRRNTALTDLGAPALTTVGGELSISNPALTSLRLPALRRLVGRLVIGGNTALRQCLVDIIYNQLTSGPANGCCVGAGNNGTPNVCP